MKSVVRGKAPCGKRPGRSPTLQRRKNRGPPGQCRVGDFFPGSSCGRSGKAAGFSLLEMLGVILILSFLVAMIFPALNRLHTGMSRRRAAAEARMLVDAVLHYRRVYDAWPGAERAPSTGGDRWYGHPDDGDTILDQAELIGALAVTNRSLNPRRIRFVDIPRDRLVEGRMVDPWQQPYVVALDHDGDGQIHGVHPAIPYTLNSHDPVLVLSLGEPGATPNPVFSWSTP